MLDQVKKAKAPPQTPDNAPRLLDLIEISDPKYADAHYNLAVLLENHREDEDGAEEHYLKALRIDPNNAMARKCFAELLQRTTRQGRLNYL